MQQARVGFPRRRSAALTSLEVPERKRHLLIFRTTLSSIFPSLDTVRLGHSGVHLDVVSARWDENSCQALCHCSAGQVASSWQKRPSADAGTCGYQLYIKAWAVNCLTKLQFLQRGRVLALWRNVVRAINSVFMNVELLIRNRGV